MTKKPSKQKPRRSSKPKRNNDPANAAAENSGDTNRRNALLESLTFRWQADGLSAEALKQVFGPTPPIRILEAAALLRKAYQEAGYGLFVTLVPIKRIPAAMQNDMTALAQLVRAAKSHLANQQDAVSLLPKVPSEILTAAIGCFDSYEAAASFLIFPSSALGDRVPAQVALSSTGKAAVLHLIGRIENGVFL